MDKRKEFAKYIKSARIDAGLSKFNASKALGYKSDGVINAIEQGRGPLPVEKISIIAKVYKLNKTDLIEKIKEYEPELYKKYLSLKRDFFEEFSETVKSAVNFAAHHKPFFLATDSLEGTHFLENKSRNHKDVFQECLIMYIM